MKPENSGWALNKSLKSEQASELEDFSKLDPEELEKELEQSDRKIKELEALIRQLEEETPKTFSRRSFLKGAAVAAAGVAVTGTGFLSLPKKKEVIPSIFKKPFKTEEESSTEKTKDDIFETKIEASTAEEIEKCKKIIKEERLEDILKAPCLVSTLYYSKEALSKMKPPHETPTQEIVWEVSQLITDQFREKYINWLKKKFINKAQSLEKFRDQPYFPAPTADFGKNLEENHQDAIDLFLKEGSPVYSTDKGIVVLAENGWNKEKPLSTSSAKGGNTVIIFNPEDDSFYRYAHFESTPVRPGEVLPSGKIIGIVGHSGLNASKPGHGLHLHFEINKYKKTEGAMIPIKVAELKKKLESIKQT